MPISFYPAIAAFLLTTALSAQPLLRVADIQALPSTPADEIIAYGDDALQFGELRLPPGEGPFPLVVILHGGCWLAEYDLHLMDALATALTAEGFATWNLEYRRVGDAGGGWPGTFLDVGAGIDHVRALTERFPLDPERVVLLGHSAGGHLALWAAARSGLPADSPLQQGNPLPVSGVVSLAGITDLTTYLVPEGSACGAGVPKLLGGLPEEVPERYAWANPIVQLPVGVPRVLIGGEEDRIVPLAHVQPYHAAARAAGGAITLKTVTGAGHFEVIAPESIAWPEVLSAVRQLTELEAPFLTGVVEPFLAEQWTGLPNVRDFTLSPDGGRLYVTIRGYKPGFSFIARLDRTAEGWSKPVVASFSGLYSDLEPAFSPDGRRLYFASNRPLDGSGEPKDFDIWYVDRLSSGEWSEPVNPGEPVNETGDEYFPSVTAEGVLYFTAQRDGGPGREDIYRCVPDGNGAFGPAIPLDTAINSAAYEFNAYVSPAGDLLIFSSHGRADGRGGGDLYLSRKQADGSWSPARNLGPGINTEGLDYCPFYDAGRQRLYFTSQRNAVPTHFSERRSLTDYLRLMDQYRNGLDRPYEVELILR